MERYKVGHVMSLRNAGSPFANVRIIRRFIAEDGNKMVEAEIIDIASAYSGEIRMAARVTFPEDDPSLVCVCPI